MIRFTRVISGTHGAPMFDAPALQRKTVKFWGLIGEGELVGQRGGRWIDVFIWLHGNYTSAAALTRELESLDRMVGRHGDLVITGSYSRRFRNCTFDGFTPAGERGGPIRDVAGTLDGGWWTAGNLRWRQLRDF